MLFSRSARRCGAARNVRRRNPFRVRWNTHAHALFLAGVELDGTPYRAARDRHAVREQADFAARKENRAPGFLAINPEGKVPTLMIDGRPLTEVAAILFYLARRFPEAGLCPRATSRPKRKSSRGCRSSPRRSIRRAASGIDRWREVFGLAERGWGSGNGRSGAIRSPTSTCSACIGVSSSRSPGARRVSRTSLPTTTA